MAFSPWFPLPFSSLPPPRLHHLSPPFPALLLPRTREQQSILSYTTESFVLQFIGRTHLYSSHTLPHTHALLTPPPILCTTHTQLPLGPPISSNPHLKWDWVANELWVLLHDLLNPPLLQVLCLVFLQIQHNLCPSAKWLSLLVTPYSEGTTSRWLPYVLLIVIVLNRRENTTSEYLLEYILSRSS